MRAKFVVLSAGLIAAAMTLGCSGAPESPNVAAPSAAAPGAETPAAQIDSSDAGLETPDRPALPNPGDLNRDAVEYFPSDSEVLSSTEAAAMAAEIVEEPEPAPKAEPLGPYRPEDGSFEVLFPTAPETANETLQDGGKLAIYRSSATGLEHQVNAFDLPEAMTREDAEATLQSVVGSIIEAAGAEANEQNVIAGLDYPAVRYDYVYEAEGERFRTAGILAVVDSRQFQASVLSTEDAWDAEASATFLDSFRPSYQTPTLTAPQFSGPQVARTSQETTGPQEMKILPASAPTVKRPSTESTAAEDPVPAGVERKLPWVDATVEFPAEPETLTDDATVETDRMFHAFSGAQSFSVTLHREEEALPVEISREILAATAEAIAASVDGVEVVSEPVANEDFADHRLSYRYAGDGSGPVQVRQRLLFVDSVQVYLIVAGPVEGFDEATAERFLNSWSNSGSDAVAEGGESESIDAR